MKKLIPVLLTFVMIFSMAFRSFGADSASSDSPRDYLDYLWELSENMSDEEFTKYAVRNFKFIQSIELLFEEESYQTFYKANVHLKQKAEGSRQEFLEAQNNLIMKTSVADGVYFLWDKDNIPYSAEDASLTEEQLDAAPLDGVGFVPLLVKCLLDDPSQAKGNIIFITGGAGGNRANDAEAYPAIPVFQELGYNVFVLQFRVAPYAITDTFMDGQRAIRFVRYYAEKEGWGGQDMIAGASWGSGVGGPISSCYGYSTPADTFAPDYIPDELDQINSDWDVALSIYGSGVDETCENPNIPALYMCVGSEDAVVGVNGMLKFYDLVTSRGVPAVLRVIEGAGHGFGVGQEGATNSVPECAEWPAQADEFMMMNKGHSTGVPPTGTMEIPLPDKEYPDVTAPGSDSNGESQEGESAGESAGESGDSESAPVEPVEIPAEYTRTKEIHGTYGFGDADITAAINDDGTKFFLTWVSFGENQILEGDIVDGLINITYDLSGFVSGDGQLIWDDVMADSSPWMDR